MNSINGAYETSTDYSLSRQLDPFSVSDAGWWPHHSGQGAVRRRLATAAPAPADNHPPAASPNAAPPLAATSPRPAPHAARVT